MREKGDRKPYNESLGISVAVNLKLAFCRHKNAHRIDINHRLFIYSTCLSYELSELMLLLLCSH